MSPPVAEPTAHEQSSSTVRFLNAIRERWWVIVVSGLICASGALAYSLTETKVYEASASLLFRNTGFSNAIFGADIFGPSTDPTKDTATNISLITSLEVADRVQKKLNLTMSPEDLLSGVSVEQNDNSDLVGVAYASTNPRFAARVATEFATQFVAARQEADRQKVADAEALIRKRLAKLPPGATDERSQLEDALQTLVPLEAIQTGNAEVVDEATVPTQASSPAPKRDAMLGLVLGLALGAAIAFALDFLDRRIRSADDFEELYGLPVLTRIPHKAIASYDPARQSAEAFEPYRMLRNALGTLRAEGNPLRVLLVTSAVPDEGKTIVSVNLARAVALTGSDAALVEADIRDPDLGKHFPLDHTSPDLTTTLLDGADEDSLQRVSPGRWAEAPDLPSGEIVLMPAGSPPPNASELLSGPAMRGLLSWLSEMSDLVVLDAPPLLPVADTHALLDQGPIDGCLIVARASSTTEDQVRRTRAILEQHHALDVVGVVVTDTDESETAYGFYGLPQDLLSDAPAAPAELSAPEAQEPAVEQAPAPPPPAPETAAPADAPVQLPPPPAAQPAPAAAPPSPLDFPPPQAPAVPPPAVPANGRPWQGNGVSIPPPQPVVPQG